MRSCPASGASMDKPEFHHVRPLTDSAVRAAFAEEARQHRGSGRTTRQMQEAPRNAIFVWCNNHTLYPQQLARQLGRTDLRIVGPSWLDHGWAGLWQPVVADHATPGVLTHGQWNGYMRILERMDRMQSEMQAAPVVPEQPAPEPVRELCTYETSRGAAAASVDLTPEAPCAS